MLGIDVNDENPHSAGSFLCRKSRSISLAVTLFPLALWLTNLLCLSGFDPIWACSSTLVWVELISLLFLYRVPIRSCWMMDLNFWENVINLWRVEFPVSIVFFLCLETVCSEWEGFRVSLVYHLVIWMYFLLAVDVKG